VTSLTVITVCVETKAKNLQSHVSPTQMMTRQTRDDTPITAARIITTYTPKISHKYYWQNVENE